MGCGGSRADAIIEPRYHESWTRETESTWLTNTDVETPLPVANSKIIAFVLSKLSVQQPHLA
uniref:Brain and acute leukemia cytoplasmic protein n=1 Tax=Neogobius melanostomus TaxID=47308 RepID=A0A8C6TPV5_9GOBI